MEHTPQPTPSNPQPADEQAAHDGTSQYGDFGHPADPHAPRHYQALTNDGSNDNPDEFSEFRGKHAAATEHYCMPEAIAAAEGGSDAEERAAYALDDPRYAGGDVFDLKDEQTGL